MTVSGPSSAHASIQPQDRDLAQPKAAKTSGVTVQAANPLAAQQAHAASSETHGAARQVVGTPSPVRTTSGKPVSPARVSSGGISPWKLTLVIAGLFSAGFDRAAAQPLAPAPPLHPAAEPETQGPDNAAGAEVLFGAPNTSFSVINSAPLDVTPTPSAAKADAPGYPCVPALFTALRTAGIKEFVVIAGTPGSKVVANAAASIVGEVTPVFAQEPGHERFAAMLDRGEPGALVIVGGTFWRVATSTMVNIAGVWGGVLGALGGSYFLGGPHGAAAAGMTWSAALSGFVYLVLSRQVPPHGDELRQHYVKRGLPAVTIPAMLINSVISEMLDPENAHVIVIAPPGFADVLGNFSRTIENFVQKMESAEHPLEAPQALG